MAILAWDRGRAAGSHWAPGDPRGRTEGLLELMETNALLSQKGKLRPWEDKGFLEVTKGRVELV